MTSKEAIKRIKKSHFISMACLDGIEDKETEQAINIIEKDLEVLEIIKDVFNYKSIQKFVDNLSGEDFIKVSRWFENDK